MIETLFQIVKVSALLVGDSTKVQRFQVILLDGIPGGVG